jgi:hypothetical protein
MQNIPEMNSQDFYRKYLHLNGFSFRPTILYYCRPNYTRSAMPEFVERGIVRMSVKTITRQLHIYWRITLYVLVFLVPFAGRAMGTETSPSYAQMPKSFTVTYRVVRTDVRTLAMRKNEAQQVVEYWKSQLRAGHITPMQAKDWESSGLKEYGSIYPAESYTVIVSSDGSQILCDAKNNKGGGETVAIHAADSDKTYVMDTDTPTKVTLHVPQVHVYPGFNFSAMKLAPLILYYEPTLDLFFMKDAQLQPLKNISKSSSIIEFGHCVGTFENIDEAESEIPYGDAMVTLVPGKDGAYIPSSCIRQYHIDHIIASTWAYDGYSDLGGIDVIPKKMTWTDYQTFTMTRPYVQMPKFVYKYTLLNAAANALDSKKFNINTWVAGSKRTVVIDQSLKNPLVFAYYSSQMSLAQGEANYIASLSKTQKNNNWHSSAAMFVATATALTLWIAFRRKQLAAA